MKRHAKQIFATLLIAVLLTGILTACGSSEPCHHCGNIPTKGYKNEYTGEKEYYCKECYTDCAFCSGKATKHYTSALGIIVFICDDCYEEIQALDS